MLKQIGHTSPKLIANMWLENYISIKKKNIIDSSNWKNIILMITHWMHLLNQHIYIVFSIENDFENYIDEQPNILPSLSLLANKSTGNYPHNLMGNVKLTYQKKDRISVWRNRDVSGKIINK